MAATLREHHPDASLTVLLLDADPREVEEIPCSHMLGFESLLGEQSGLLAAGNPPGGLTMAVLPHLVRAVFDSGEQSVLYIGVGLRVLGGLEPLLAALADHQIVLVARARAMRPSSAAFGHEPATGVFSPQLLGLRAGTSTAALLAAWPRYFAADADDGAGAMRAWLDSVPALAEDVEILRDSDWAIDLSTLALRVRRDVGQSGLGDGRIVDPQAARLLDFSELDPDDPPVWLDGEERIPVNSIPGLDELIARQAEDLRAAGLQNDSAFAGPYRQLDDGLLLSPTIRTLLAEAITAGDISRSPFTERGRAELYRYLNQPGAGGRDLGLTRLHMAIWAAQAHLRSSYPHIAGPDGEGFAGWLCRYGREQEGLVSELLPPTPEIAYRDADPHIHEDEPRWGVNVVGFFTAELGVGEAARLLVAGLDAQGIPILPIQGRLTPPSRQGADFRFVRPDEAAYPINVLAINGDGIPVFAREAGRSFFEGRYTIASWWWEVGEPPASWAPAYEFIDEVWVASQYVYDAIAPSAPVPVVRMTQPLVAPDVSERTRAELGLPQEGFLFMCVYDYHSVSARKNPLGMIEAFRRAFNPGSGAKLVLKSINARTRPGEHARVVAAARDHDDITLLDEYVSSSDKNAMIAAGDCYLSLHRAEGFGLPLAEAMALGKPVIATRYGGTLEFMNDENSFLVKWRPTPVGDGAYPYSPDAVWAEPDLDHAASLMRHVFAAPDEARQRGAIARREVLEKHSPDVAGESMRRRLSLIHERLYHDGARSLNLAHLPSLDEDEQVRAMLTERPTIHWGGGRLGRLKWRAHRPVADWAKAYIAHQSAVDTEMRRAIARIDARLHEVARTLEGQHSAKHAETLAVLRRVEAELAEVRRRDGTTRAPRPHQGT
jgi:glycosyltransferase involved in cell wall biosynthesis